MKIEFSEYQFGADIQLTPETPKEFAQILRFTKNAAAKKATIYFSFSSDEPVCSIFMDKVKPTVQSKSIRPGK
jgi:hypothetical protein